jgi:hypothetical protein
VVGAARSEDGKATEIVAVLPPIMKARRVVACLLRPVDRLLIAASLSWRRKGV